MCAIVWSLGHLLTFLLFFVMGMKTDLNIYVYTHTHTHTHLNHFAVHQKLTQHCISITLQLKKKSLKNPIHNVKAHLTHAAGVLCG